MKFLVFGGGGKVGRHFARLAVKEGHEVLSVVRDDTHSADLTALGAQPLIHSLETSTVPDLTSLLTSHSPNGILFAAGAAGKGGAERTRAVDYEGTVKVFDAMEAGNVKRLVLVGAVDVRDREKGYPEWYDEASKKKSDQMWKAIPAYMQAKYDAEVELHSRKSIAFTVLRPGGLTEEPAGGAEVGKTQVRKTSRELVAQAALVAFETPSTEGLSLDIMDGEQDVKEAIEKAGEDRVDSWTG